MQSFSSSSHQESRFSSMSSSTCVGTHTKEHLRSLKGDSLRKRIAKYVKPFAAVVANVNLPEPILAPLRLKGLIWITADHHRLE